MQISVDFEESPMFTESKPLSLLVDRHEFLEKLGLRSNVNLAVIYSAVDHGVPLGFTDTQFRVDADYFDDDGRLGFVGKTHR